MVDAVRRARSCPPRQPIPVPRFLRCAGNGTGFVFYGWPRLHLRREPLCPREIESIRRGIHGVPANTFLRPSSFCILRALEWTECNMKCLGTVCRRRSVQCRNASLSGVQAGGGYGYIPGSLLTAARNSSGQAEKMTVAEAKTRCNQTSSCLGFSYRKPGLSYAAGNSSTSASTVADMFFMPCVALTHRRKCDWSVVAGSVETGWHSWTKGAETMPIMFGNTIYTDAADPAELSVGCYNDTERANPYAAHSRFTFVEWQKKGHSAGDIVRKTPTTVRLIAMARAALMKPTRSKNDDVERDHVYTMRVRLMHKT